MAKRSARRNRYRAGIETKGRGRKPSTHPLRITIATYPESDSGGISLARDVDLVKAAVLYADEVELMSAGASMLTAMRELADAGAIGLAQVLATLDDDTVRFVGGGNLPDNWRESLLPAMVVMSLEPDVLRSLPGGDEITEDQLDEFRSASEGMDAVTTELLNTSASMLEHSGADKILPAIDAGIVRLVDIGVGADDMIEQWTGHLRQLLTSSSARLLFDDKVGEFVKTLVEFEGIDPTGLPIRHAGEAAVGSGLIARLPVFVDPPIDEILQLRTDLRDPLRKYRAASMRLANGLQVPAYEPGSADEIDDLFRAEVEPVLAELGEGFANHGLVREVARSLGTDVKTLVATGGSAALYMALNTGAAVNSMIAAAVGAAAGGAQAIASGSIANAKVKRELTSKELFFLYEVNRRL